jgi:hypothetical protein
MVGGRSAPTFDDKENESMRILRVAVAGCALLACSSFAADSPATSAPPTGVKSRSEEVQGKVLRVFAVDESGYRYRAYMVKWKDYDVVVHDYAATSDYKEGQTIRFAVVHIDIPGRPQIGFTLLGASDHSPSKPASK